ncbi:MAG: M4 family metallopeptidase [Deltaproteobacteria bacterium]|nr:M4 family metallopeptidase [Deltaproteobacteria bacterium]
MDPTAREAARARAATNPLGLPIRDDINRDRLRLGYSSDDRFELLRVHRDELGWLHAHLQQTFFGIPVEGGELIAHERRDGTYAPHDDGGVHGISTSPTPRITAADAISIAERDPSHTSGWADPPSATLAWLPVYEARLARGGGPVPPVSYDQDVPNAMVDPIGSDDVGSTLAHVHLVWRVIGAEHDARADAWTVRTFAVDAHDGTVIEARDLADPVVGSGQGFWNPSVQFETMADGSCWRMEDGSRKFRTETEDFGSDEPVNCDQNNQWGDGQPFAGDNVASTANWQTAMVDGHFGATVYWDLLSNVFGFQGPDDDYYSVNVFMHHGTEVDNAFYHSMSGNVSFGDGTDGANRTVIDCLGHELGHAWNDHNIGYDGDADALNESLADVFGEWTEAYLVSNGFANSASTVGAVGDVNWVNDCSGRGMINPRRRYWFSSILDYEAHSASRPATRAFTMLARGASPWMRDPSYSRKTPWGLTGIGLHSAARVFFTAHRDWIDDHDYAGVRTGMVKAANHLFGNSAELRATRNAYHAINVGAADPTLPITVSPTAEVEPNDGISTAQYLGIGALAPAGAVASAPRKINLIGGGNTADYYRVSLRRRIVTVNLTPLFGIGGTPTFSLLVFDANGQMIGLSGPSTNPMLVDLAYPTAGAREIFIRVLPVSAPSTAMYQLEIDLDN